MSSSSAQRRGCGAPQGLLLVKLSLILFTSMHIIFIVFAVNICYGSSFYLQWRDIFKNKGTIPEYKEHFTTPTQSSISSSKLYNKRISELKNFQSGRYLLSIHSCKNNYNYCQFNSNPSDTIPVIVDWKISGLVIINILF